MTQAELAATAAAMLAELPITGHAERVLQDRARRPVYLGLTRRNHHVSLVVGHRDVYPCREDADAIARHFGIGEETEPRAQGFRLPSQDGATVPVRGMVYTWIETAM